MNNNMPPQFNKKKKRNATPLITIIICAILSLVIGFGGAMIAMKITTGSNSGVTIVQQSGNSSASNTINDVSDIASKCGPSVVEIETEYVSSGNSMFGQYVSTGAGSGVIISEDGYIVTNNHVIEDATSILVRTTDGTEYDATLIGTDSQTDIAVIKINETGLVAATFGDSDSLEVGDGVVAIGNPLGELGGTVTTGIISALERQILVEDEIMTLLQTDAAINPGNSGGGLFDASGNLVGIVNAKESSTGIEGLGFAIPINSAIEVINELIENGAVTNRPDLNVTLYDYTARSSYYYSRNSYESGCYIVQIVYGGAADEAGLQQNDRIVEFDGESISSSAQVKAILRKHAIGDTVDITVDREGEEISTTVTLQSSAN